MKKSFAIDLESAISEELERLKNREPELECLWKLLLTLQREFIQTLQADGSAAIDEDRLIGSAAAWKEVNVCIADMSDRTLQKIMPLWTVHSFFERAVQYYHQAAVNSAYPRERAFFHSLEQVKLIIKRKLGGNVRTMHNHIWGQLGFAPFMIGKE